jgi:hypothetical protein
MTFWCNRCPSFVALNLAALLAHYAHRHPDVKVTT